MADRKAQSFLEYVAVVMVTSLALSAMSLYFNRAINSVSREQLEMRSENLRDKSNVVPAISLPRQDNNTGDIDSLKQRVDELFRVVDNNRKQVEAEFAPENLVNLQTDQAGATENFFKTTGSAVVNNED